jgi:hypothetical protein
LENRKTFALSSALMFLLMILAVGYVLFRRPTFHVSAIETQENIGVYWDENCNQRTYSIDWGTLPLATTKQMTVWVRNEANETFLLVLTPTNWNPLNASRYLTFSWLCTNNIIRAHEVANITMRLQASPSTVGISSFSFDIVLEGKYHFPGDLNNDGVVDSTDLGVFSSAFGSTPKDPLWNPDADLNKDSVVDSLDLVLLGADFGRTWAP